MVHLKYTISSNLIVKRYYYTKVVGIVYSLFYGPPSLSEVA